MPVPTQEAIDDQMNLAVEGIDGGTRWSGMSYEEGVNAALMWVQGHTDELPIDVDE